MSKKNEKIEKHLRHAMEEMTPDAADRIWEQPAVRAEKEDWFLDGTQQKQARRGWYYKWAGLAAACFVIVILSWFQLYRAADAAIYLDVNPSISLSVSRSDKVVKAEAENHDGEVILEEMDLRGVKADVAVNALLGSMVRHGYLSQEQNAVLVSVEGKSTQRTDSLMQKISTDTKETMTTLLGDGIVLYQKVETDSREEETARTYQISPGKAALILRLTGSHSDWNLAELAGMPVEQLIRYCLLSDVDITEYLDRDGGVIGNIDDLREEILEELEESDSPEEIYEELLEEIRESDEDRAENDDPDDDDRYDNDDRYDDDQYDNDQYDNDDWDDQYDDDRYDSGDPDDDDRYDNDDQDGEPDDDPDDD